MPRPNNDLHRVILCFSLFALAPLMLLGSSVHSEAVISSNSLSLRLVSPESERISTPGPIVLDDRPLGKI